MKPKLLAPVKHWTKIRIAPDVMVEATKRAKKDNRWPQQQINHDLRRLYAARKKR